MLSDKQELKKLEEEIKELQEDEENIDWHICKTEDELLSLKNDREEIEAKINEKNIKINEVKDRIESKKPLRGQIDVFGGVFV